jgi:hypothetical protein
MFWSLTRYETLVSSRRESYGRRDYFYVLIRGTGEKWMLGLAAL